MKRPPFITKAKVWYKTTKMIWEETDRLREQYYADRNALKPNTETFFDWLIAREKETSK